MSLVALKADTVLDYLADIEVEPREFSITQQAYDCRLIVYFGMKHEPVEFAGDIYEVSDVARALLERYLFREKRAAMEVTRKYVRP